MPKKSDHETQLILHQNDLLKAVLKRQRKIIKNLRKEIMRLNQKFILYFQYESEYSDSSNVDMSDGE